MLDSVGLLSTLASQQSRICIGCDEVTTMVETALQRYGSRLASMVHRLTYANVVATLAVFIALGGASYAASQLPANSVGTRQLSFPLGLKSHTQTRSSIPVLVCPAGAPCPPPKTKALVSVHVHFKSRTQALVLGSVTVQSAPKPTVLDIGAEINRSLGFEHYRVGVPPTIRIWRIVSLSAGSHTVLLMAGAHAESGPAKALRADDAQVAVVALPRLG
jgi:hypothetical protein